jgi:hypothetical protein
MRCVLGGEATQNTPIQLFPWLNNAAGIPGRKIDLDSTVRYNVFITNGGILNVNY